MSDGGRRQSSAGANLPSRYIAGMIILPIAFVLLASQQAVTPAPPPAACATIDTDLPAALAGWKTTGTGMAMDRAFQLPANNGEASANFMITKPGRYRVALDQPGWVDLVRDGKALTSVAHGHGPKCSTIRKIIDFDLAAGSYTLKLTKLTKAQAKTMIVAS